MFSARFLAMPAIALTVIVALAQAHSRPDASQTTAPTVYRAVNCATSGCAVAGNGGTSMVR